MKTAILVNGHRATNSRSMRTRTTRPAAAVSSPPTGQERPPARAGSSSTVGGAADEKERAEVRGQRAEVRGGRSRILRNTSVRRLQIWSAGIHHRFPFSKPRTASGVPRKVAISFKRFRRLKKGKRQ